MFWFVFYSLLPLRWKSRNNKRLNVSPLGKPVSLGFIRTRDSLKTMSSSSADMKCIKTIHNNYHGLMIRICLKSRTHLLEDNFLFRHNLYVWLCNVSIGRNKMLVIPLTWRTFPPSGKVSKASGRGVFEESRNTEWVVNEKFCDSKSGSIESLWWKRKITFQKIKTEILVREAIYICSMQRKLCWISPQLVAIRLVNSAFDLPNRTVNS